LFQTANIRALMTNYCFWFWWP